MFDANRELAWSVNNDELGGIFNDVCGLQVLKSGNILVSTCAHHTPKPHDLNKVARPTYSYEYSARGPS